MSNAGSSDGLKAGVPPSVAGETRAVDAATRPGTVNSLSRDLRSLGVAEGMTLLVHSSMSALGWVAGGPSPINLKSSQSPNSETRDSGLALRLHHGCGGDAAGRESGRRGGNPGA